MGEGPAGELQGTAWGGDIQSSGSLIVPIENFLEAERRFARSRNAEPAPSGGGRVPRPASVADRRSMRPVRSAVGRA
jgi:hypothetical protein